MAGTLRAALLEQGAVAENSLTLNQLADVERLWVANSVQGVWPVTKLLSASGSLLQRWSLSHSDPFQRLAHQLLGVV